MTCLQPFGWEVRHLLAEGRRCPQGTPVSSANKIDGHMTQDVLFFCCCFFCVHPFRRIHFYLYMRDTLLSTSAPRRRSISNLSCPCGTRLRPGRGQNLRPLDLTSWALPTELKKTNPVVCHWPFMSNISCLSRDATHTGLKQVNLSFRVTYAYVIRACEKSSATNIIVVAPWLEHLFLHEIGHWFSPCLCYTINYWLFTWCLVLM